MNLIRKTVLVALGLIAFAVPISGEPLSRPEPATVVDTGGPLRVENGKLIGAFAELGQPGSARGFLIDRSTARSRIGEFTGLGDAPVAAAADWRQMYLDLQMSTESPVFPSLSALNARVRDLSGDRVVPVALLSASYDRIRPELIENETLKLDPDGVYRPSSPLSGSPFETGRVFTAAVLGHTQVPSGPVQLRFPGALQFSNLALSRLRLELPLGGSVDLVADSRVEVQFAPGETKTFRVVGEDPEGRKRTARFQLTSGVIPVPPPDLDTLMTATMAYQGSPATARVYVYKSAQHTQLTNPVIVLDGLDIENGLGSNRGWYGDDGLYALLLQNNLIETLRSFGRDFVVVDYTNSLRYIQDNAYVFMKVLDWVNSVKVGGEPNVVVGPSMGGLVARYGLVYMEDHGLPHDVETFITLDTPHQFANLPLGDQYLVDFFAGDNATAQAFDNIIKSPSPKQMLFYHVEQLDAIAKREQLFAELEAMGDYPSQPRLVAIADGSAAGQAQAAPNNTHMFIVDGQVDSGHWWWPFDADIYAQTFPVPGSAPDRIFFGKVEDSLTDLDIKTRTVTLNPGPRYDQAPGGMRDTQQALEDAFQPELNSGVAVAISPDHCFIPTISALDVDTADLWYNIDGDPFLTSKTPFDRVYFQANNLDHIRINGSIGAWLVNEVMGAPTPPVVDIIYPDFFIGAPPTFQTLDQLTINWHVSYGAPEYTRTELWLILDDPWRSAWPINTNQSVDAGGNGSYTMTIPWAGAGPFYLHGLQTMHKIQVHTFGLLGVGQSGTDESASYFTIDWKDPPPRGGDDEPDIHDDPGGKHIPGAIAVAPGVFVTDPSPNPAAGLVQFSLELEQPEPVRMAVFDARGRRVRSLMSGETREAGVYRLTWDGNSDAGGRVPGGVYFVRVHTPGGSYASKIIRTP